MSAPPLRVASVPGQHAYIRRLDLARAGIRVLDDPRPLGAEPGRWWPPVMLEADWIAEHAAAFDLLHLHFGAESFGIPALSAAIAALRLSGRPLVFTVHDLEHPQLADQTHHRAQLDLLIAAADELITLTPGAAAEIERRWGRAATVIRHPALANADTAHADTAAGPQRATADPSRPFTVGVHLRDLRPGIDGPGTVQTLARALARLAADGAAVHGRVSLFDRVRDPIAEEAITAIVAASSQLSLARHPRLSDTQLEADLLELDASLLPYRHGTHSGWAELCWDLVLPVIGAPIGYVADQHTETGWFHPVELGDSRTLYRALTRLAHPRALAAARNRRSGRIAVRARVRRAEAPALARAHREVYERALRRAA